jgi:mRNA interferase HigB
MNVISRDGLMAAADAQRVDAATRKELETWLRISRHARWSSLADVRQTFPSADRVGAVLIFNIRHNQFRLIVRHGLPGQALFVKALLTHKEYDRKEWLKWA